MPVVVIGLSHHSSPVEVRERFAMETGRIPALLRELREGGEVEEAVILSTCNRVELYAVGDGHHANYEFGEPLDTAVRKRDALAKARTSKPFAFNQTGKNVFARNFRPRLDQQFAEDFEAVLFATRIRVAQHIVGLDDVLEQH